MLIAGILGFITLVMGIGLITDSSVRMRGGRSGKVNRSSAMKEMLLGIVVGLLGFALLLYAITGGGPLSAPPA